MYREARTQLASERASAAVLNCSILRGRRGTTESDCSCCCAAVAMHANCHHLSTTTMTTLATSGVRRCLQFDSDDDEEGTEKRQKSSSPETGVPDYVERLYVDQVARWNMEFRTLTPLKGGRWQWDRVTLASPSTCLAVDTSAASSTVSRSILTKKNRKRKITGE